MLQLASVFHDGLTRFVLPLCTMMTDRPDLSGPITSSVYLVDASRLGLKQGWALKTFAQEISWLLSTCYPETITRVYVSAYSTSSNPPLAQNSIESRAWVPWMFGYKAD